MTPIHSLIITLTLSVSVFVDLSDAWTSFQWRAPSRNPPSVAHDVILCLTKQPTNNDENHFLNDDKGHIRRDLATSIYQWDHLHASNLTPENTQFSTRDGLRMVDAMAKQLLQNTNHAREETTYSDLVQEGIMALLQAMTTYHDDETTSSREAEFFPDYARAQISKSMTRALAQEVRPMSLPPKILQLLQQAKQKREELASESGREPTMAQVASELNVSPQQLELYTMLGSTSLSVERTMEIYNTLQNDVEFADTDTWQAMHNTDVDVNVDPQEEQEGEDEMYVSLETVAAPLEEMIVDGDTFDNPDQVMLETMIHDGVQELLRNTLDTEEFRILQLKYGLDEERSMTRLEIATLLEISESQVAEIETGAMKKLRLSLPNFNRQQNNVETLLDEADGGMEQPPNV